MLALNQFTSTATGLQNKCLLSVALRWYAAYSDFIISGHAFHCWELKWWENQHNDSSWGLQHQIINLCGLVCVGSLSPVLLMSVLLLARLVQELQVQPCLAVIVSHASFLIISAGVCIMSFFLKAFYVGNLNKWREYSFLQSIVAFIFSHFLLISGTCRGGFVSRIIQKACDYFRQTAKSTSCLAVIITKIWCLFFVLFFLGEVLKRNHFCFLSPYP